jgi:hypothetical protein
MKTISGSTVVALLMLALVGTAVAAQTAAPSQTSNNPTPTQASSVSADSAAPQRLGHGAFPVKVTKTLDSSKLKPGDVVEFKTAGIFALPSGTRVPEGAKVTGHVTEAKARSKGDPQSVLSIAFEQINLGNGKQLTVKGTIQAVGSNPDEDNPTGASGPSMAKTGGPGAAGWTPTTDIKSGSNMQTVDTASPLLNPKSTGVQGLHGLQLESDGVLTSEGKHVKLDPGVRIIVRAEIQEWESSSTGWLSQGMTGGRRVLCKGRQFTGTHFHHIELRRPISSSGGRGGRGGRAAAKILGDGLSTIRTRLG